MECILRSLMAAIVVATAVEPNVGTPRLPITRTIQELDWRWLEADASRKVSQEPDPGYLGITGICEMNWLSSSSNTQL